MNGLQFNLKARSKDWQGSIVYSFKQKPFSKKNILDLSNLSEHISLESNFEGVVDINGVLMPGLFRGIYKTNKSNLKSQTNQLVLVLVNC